MTHSPTTTPSPSQTELVLPEGNQRILAAIYKALNGDLDVVDHASGFCMKAVRQVVEHAFGMQDGQLYKYYSPIDYVPRQPGDEEPNSVWARDMERTWRGRGYWVSPDEALPGDILFNYRGGVMKNGNTFGHVGILIPGNLVFENINPKYRATSGFSRQMLALTPLKLWPGPVTTVIRLPVPAFTLHSS